MPALQENAMFALEWTSTAFREQKLLLEHAAGVHNDALHVLVGVAIQLVAALILRKSLAHWAPLFTVILLELANELNDVISQTWPEPAVQLGEGIKDLVLTVAIPVLLFVIARLNPWLISRPPIKSDTAETAE